MAPTTSTSTSARPTTSTTIDEQRDELPDDLDADGFVGPYQFPDNSRRRIPGIIYLGLAVGCVVAYRRRRATRCSSTTASSGRRSCSAASVSSASRRGGGCTSTRSRRSSQAQQAVGFPVGHASAQQVWHGVRSRPTWRVLCYSTEEPPRQRGLVLVDAVDGRVLEHLVEANPEEWAAGAPPEISASE